MNSCKCRGVAESPNSTPSGLRCQRTLWEVQLQFHSDQSIEETCASAIFKTLIGEVYSAETDLSKIVANCRGGRSNGDSSFDPGLGKQHVLAFQRVWGMA